MQLVPDINAWQQDKEMAENWTGIVLYPGKNASWATEENTQATKLALQKNIFAAIGICLGLILFTVAALQSVSVLFSVFGLLSLVGLVITFFILAAELGYQNKIVKQVCGAVSASGCEQVLQSKQAKNFFGFTPADAGLIYFTTQFLAFLLIPLYPVLTNVMYCLALTGIAVVGWSIYTQAVTLKKYCALCLALVAVLMLQFAVALAALPFAGLTIMPFIMYAAAVLLLAVLLFPIKQLLKNNTNLQQQAAELKKWKTDASIFNALSANERMVDTSIWENDLLLGNANAPIKITVACNPYCGPCAKAHKALDELLEMYPNEVAVQVRLLCSPDNEKDSRTIATKAILQQAAVIKENKKLQQMIGDWFHFMDLEKWKTSWNGEAEKNVESKLLQHQQWTTDAAIKFTPTFFINGKHLNGKYNLENIKQLIPKLAEAGAENGLQ